MIKKIVYLYCDSTRKETETIGTETASANIHLGGFA
jgi:hypothetical protein